MSLRFWEKIQALLWKMIRNRCKKYVVYIVSTSCLHIVYMMGVLIRFSVWYIYNGQFERYRKVLLKESIFFCKRIEQMSVSLRPIGFESGVFLVL